MRIESFEFVRTAEVINLGTNCGHDPGQKQQSEKKMFRIWAQGSYRKGGAEEYQESNSYNINYVAVAVAGW